MSALWTVLAVYLTGYGVHATMIAADLHYLQDTDPEVAAASHARPILAAVLLWGTVIAQSLIWPAHACHISWWRRAAGLPIHR